METLGIDKVKIFHADFKVDYEHKMLNDRDLYGECNYCSQTINISSGINASKQASVLIHEMLHAGLKFTNDKLNKEETIILLQTVVSTIIKDNKEAFKTIIEKL